MERNLSFILNNVKVYTDTCLVRDEIPIFFTCIDDEKRCYLALCTDMDMPRYCVIRVTISQLYNMLYGNISMKKIFMLQEKCWIVTPIDNHIENDEVLWENISDLDKDELPDENAYFELFNDELKIYARTISEKMLEGEYTSTAINSFKLSEEMQEEVVFNVSYGIDEVSVSVEMCDTTEIRKPMIVQNVVLPKYNKEEGCVIVQTNYSVLDQKNISSKILIESMKADSLLAAA